MWSFYVDIDVAINESNVLKIRWTRLFSDTFSPLNRQSQRERRRAGESDREGLGYDVCYPGWMLYNRGLQPLFLRELL